MDHRSQNGLTILGYFSLFYDNLHVCTALDGTLKLFDQYLAALMEAWFDHLSGQGMDSYMEEGVFLSLEPGNQTVLDLLTELMPTVSC